MALIPSVHRTYDYDGYLNKKKQKPSRCPGTCARQSRGTYTQQRAGPKRARPVRGIR